MKKKIIIRNKLRKKHSRYSKNINYQPKKHDIPIYMITLVKKSVNLYIIIFIE